MAEKLICVVGPTASGKTAFAVELAKKYSGEIISADSMQIYKKMDIGTAKPDKDEMQGIKHYMIDEISPFESFSVNEFVKRAKKYISGIQAKGKLPIVAGGTGLFINSLIDNISFVNTSSDEVLRRDLLTKAAEKGNVDAINCLGYMYYKGEGVPLNYEKAREYYEEAAEKGDPNAFYNLANI